MLKHNSRQLEGANIVDWLRTHKNLLKPLTLPLVLLVFGVVGANFLVFGHAATGPTLYLTPSTGSVVTDSEVTVSIHENSGTETINSVQASLGYDKTQLQFVSVTEQGPFNQVLATDTATAGIVRLARGIPGGAAAVSGDNAVATLKFKVLATSGSPAISFDDRTSILARSTDSTNVLVATTGATFNVTAGTTTATGRLSVDPATVSAKTGDTFTVALNEASGSGFVNFVQANISYDSTKVQFVGISEGTVFTTVAATDTSTAGLVRIGRGIPIGGSGVSGTNKVIGLNFKMLASSGSSSIAIDKAASMLVSSSTSTNILGTVGNSTVTATAGTTTPSGTVTMSMQPGTGTYANGATIPVTISVNPGASSVTTVESIVKYPADQLQFVSATNGTAFPTAQRTNSATAGTIDIIRGISGGSPAVTTTSTVVTLNFKVIGSSGAAALTFASGSAAFDNSGTGNNVLDLANSRGASYTVTSTSPASGAVMSILPASGTYANGATIPVTVSVNPGTAAVTTAEAVITYPASQLQFVNATNSTTFPTAQRTNSATPGTIDIIRGISGGSAAVTGTSTVVTLNFKVIGTTGSAALAFANGSALYDDSGTGTNILNISGSKGSAYTIQSGSTTPSPSPSPTPPPPAPTCTDAPSTPGAPQLTTSTYTSVTIGWSASTAATACTMAGYHVSRNGTPIGDVTNGTSFTDNGLIAGTSYSYTVRAFDTAGHTSTASPAGTATTKADNVAPTTPTGVTAVANASASVTLNWTASTDLPNPGGSGIASYKVYRNGSTAPVATVTTGTSFSDASVVADTTYTYTVVAVDKVGNESAPSNIVTVKTAPPACSGAPTVPTNLTLGQVGTTSVAFTWSASTAPAGCQLVGYKVYRGATLVGTVTDTTFTDSSLTPNTIYAYTVKAYDSSAHTSAASSPLLATTQADNNAPSDPGNVVARATSAGQVTLTWTAASDDIALKGYKVYRDGTLIASPSASTLSYSDLALTPNTDYRYAVSAVDIAGNESAKVAANPSPVHTPETGDAQAPTQPTELRTLAVTTSTIAFAWSPSTDDTGVLGYRVYRGTTLLGITTANSFVDTGLTEKTEYSYTVKAFDASGNLSQASTAYAVTTLSVTADSLVGDLNGDGKVDVYDLSILLDSWEQRDVPRNRGDLDENNIVNFVDLVLLLLNYGEGV